MKLKRDQITGIVLIVLGILVAVLINHSNFAHR